MHHGVFIHRHYSILGRGWSLGDFQRIRKPQQFNGLTNGTIMRMKMRRLLIFHFVLCNYHLKLILSLHWIRFQSLFWILTSSFGTNNIPLSTGLFPPPSGALVSNLKCKLSFWWINTQYDVVGVTIFVSS